MYSLIELVTLQLTYPESPEYCNLQDCVYFALKLYLQCYQIGLHRRKDPLPKN